MKRTVTTCVMLCALVRGEADVLPSLPEPVHADTEISTNVQFNAERSDAREFGVELSFTGTAANAVDENYARWHRLEKTVISVSVILSAHLRACFVNRVMIGGLCLNFGSLN